MDISDLDVHEVITALWIYIGDFPPFDKNETPKRPIPTRQEIDNALKWGKIDYLNGRHIHIDFSNLHNINYGTYDAYANEWGAFEKVINNLRDKKKPYYLTELLNRFIPL